MWKGVNVEWCQRDKVSMWCDKVSMQKGGKKTCVKRCLDVWKCGGIECVMSIV